MRRGDVSRLSLLRSAGKQDDHGVAVPAEVDAVARSEIDAVLEDAATDTLTFDRFPSSMRRTLVVTFAAAVASRPPNHVANGLEPSRSRYSRTITILMVTQMSPSSRSLAVGSMGSATDRHERPSMGQGPGGIIDVH